MPTPITLSAEQLEQAEMVLKALAHFQGGTTAEMYRLTAEMLKIERLEMHFHAKVAEQTPHVLS